MIDRRKIKKMGCNEIKIVFSRRVNERNERNKWIYHMQ